MTRDNDLSVVAEARNGEEAVEFASRLRPDVITMDIQMPLMDGIAATRLLSQRHPEVAVLASTSDPKALDSILEAGAAQGTRKGDLGKFLGALEDLAEKLKRERGAGA